MNHRASTATTHRILVVDDNDAVLQDFRKVLEQVSDRADLGTMEAELFGSPRPSPASSRYELTCVQSGEDALRATYRATADHSPFALAFVDMRMPGWNGIETIKRLWQAQPNLEVAICSAYMDYSWHEVLAELERPGLRLVRKPWTSGEVLGVIHELLGRAKTKAAYSSANG